jgi:hypothetical protein
MWGIMSHSQLRGHKIYYDNEWKYCDTNKPTVDTHRKCNKCKQDNRPDGHDACLGELDGVMNACCGHGVEREAYVQFKDGSRIGGLAACLYLETIKENKL